MFFGGILLRGLMKDITEHRKEHTTTVGSTVLTGHHFDERIKDEDDVYGEETEITEDLRDCISVDNLTDGLEQLSSPRLSESLWQIAHQVKEEDLFDDLEMEKRRERHMTSLVF